MNLLVTGATGLLGNNAARIARDKGYQVYSISRSAQDAPALRGLGLSQHFQADLCEFDYNRLNSLSIDGVIHSAAMIHIGWSKLDESMRVNRDGTEKVLAWATEQDIPLVHVSTVNVLPIGSPETPTTETSIGDGQIPCTYVKTKRSAQIVCNRYIESGHRVYSVYPGFMLGPYDWQLSSGRMVRALKRFQPWAPAGGCSVCDPRDVASSMLRILESPPPHHHYILAGTNVSYFELWCTIARKLGSRPPLFAMRKPAKAISSWIATCLNQFLPSESDLNTATIAMGQQFHYANSNLAHRELNYSVRSMENSIDDSIEWLRSEKWI